MARVTADEPAAGLEEALAAGAARGEAANHAGNPIKDILDPPWLNKGAALLDLAVVTLLGCAMGAFSVPYGLVTEKVPEWWLAKAGPEGLMGPDGELFMGPASALGFCAGSPSWIWICCLACTAVGVLKVCVGLDEYPSFITEVKHQHVDPAVSAKVVVCCIASLCAGAAMGLEAGLGAVGAALGHLLARAVQRAVPLASREDAQLIDLRRRTYILCGIGAAFGAILPAPFTSVLLVHEISTAGNDNHAAAGDFMGGRRLPRKVMVFLVPAATAAFMVKYAIVPIEPVKQPGYLSPYDQWSPIVALGLGALAAVLGLLFLLTGVVVKLLFGGISRVAERLCGKAFRQVLLAALGGAITGTALYLFPLTFSTGKSTIPPTLRAANELGTWTLVGTGLAKSVAYWAGAHSGLVGGIFFPVLYVGLVAGEVCCLSFGLPVVWAVPVLLAALPASFVACPLTLLALPVGMFVMGPLHTVSIFVGIVVSGSLLSGTGLLQGLLAKGSG